MGKMQTPYTVARSLPELTGFSAQMVTRIFENEKGVLIFPNATASQKGHVPDHPHSPARL